MIVKILHLYYDLMNLYGEYGNVSVLKKYLEDSGIETELHRVSIGESFNITDFNFVYCAAGTERNQRLALSDLLLHRDELRTYADKGGAALFTGNSLELLGKRIFTRSGESLEGLLFADICTYQGGESFKLYKKENPSDSESIKSDTRVTGDVIFRASFTDKPLVGFVNRCGFIKGSFEPLFEVLHGIGNSPGEKADGVRIGNILGTYLTGPALVKNPALLDYIAALITNGNVKKQSYDSRNRGYELTYRELMKRFGEGA